MDATNHGLPYSLPIISLNHLVRDSTPRSDFRGELDGRIRIPRDSEAAGTNRQGKGRDREIEKDSRQAKTS